MFQCVVQGVVLIIKSAAVRSTMQSCQPYRAMELDFNVEDMQAILLIYRKP